MGEELSILIDELVAKGASDEEIDVVVQDFKSKSATPKQPKPDSLLGHVADIVKNYDVPVDAEPTPIQNAISRGSNFADQAAILSPFNTPEGEQITELANLQKEQGNYPASPAYQAFNSSKSTGEALTTLVQNPLQIIAELTAESMTSLVKYGGPRMAAGAGTGAILGSVVPGIGTAAGTGSGVAVGMADASLGLEYSGAFIESLQEAGIDVTDPEALKKAFADDDIVSEARSHALKKGIPIALFDLVSGGVAGKIITKPAKSLLGKAAKGAAEFGVQAVLGGAGEAAGQTVAGEDLNPSAIIAEMIGELGTTPIEVANAALTFNRNQTEATKIINEVADTGDPQLNAEIDAAAQIDPVDQKVLEEKKLSEVAVEHQKKVEQLEKLEEKLEEPEAENKSEKSGESAKKAPPKPSETPEYKIAVAKVEALQQKFAQLDITENADELLFDLREARQALQKIAGKPPTKSSDVKKQIEKTTGVAKAEKTVQLTPQQALAAQIRIQDRGIKMGRDFTQEQLISKIKEAAKESELTPRQVASIASRAEKVSLTPQSVQKFNDYVQKVVSDADYAEKLTTAQGLRKKIRKRVKNGTPQEKQAFKDFIQLNPDDTSLDEYIKVAEETNLGFKPLTDKSYKPLNLKRINDFTANEVTTQFEKQFPGNIETLTPAAKLERLSEKRVEERRQASNERLRAKLEKNYTPEQINAFMEVLSNESEIDKEIQDVNQKENLRQVFKELARDRQKSLPKSIDDIPVSHTELLNALLKAEVGELDADQLKLYIKISDKIIENEDFGGAGILIPILKAQQDFKKLEASGFNILSITNYETELSANLPAVFRAITGLPVDAAKFQLYLGIKGLNDVAVRSLDASEDFVHKMNEMSTKFTKTYGSKRNGFTSESISRQGIVSELIKHDPTVDPAQALQLNKDAVQATIDTHRKAGENDEATTFEKLYKPYVNSQTFEEILKTMEGTDPAGRKVLDFIIEYMKPYGQRVVDSNLLYYNKPTQLLNNYVSESVWRSVDERGEDAIDKSDLGDIDKPSFYARAANPKQDRSQLEFKRFIPEGKVLDFNLHHKVNRQIQRVHFKTEGLPLMLQVREMAKKKDRFKNILGNKLYNTIFDANQGSYYRFENNLLHKSSIPTGFDRTARGVLQFLRKWGYNLRLGGVTQWIKQPMVLVNTSIQAGVGNTQRAISDILSNKEAYAKFIEGETVSKRGHQKSLWNIGDSYVASLDKGLKNEINKGLQSGLTKYTDAAFENNFTGIGALLKADAFAANPSYLAFYISHLEKTGQKYEGLESESELRNTPERQEARAVAKQMLDDLQVPSNPAEMTAAIQYDKDYKSQLLKNVLFPFGGFATGMKQRLVSDWRALFKGNKAQRKYAGKDMAAALAESAMFQAANQFVLGYLFHLLGEGYEWLFDLPNDDDEEKYKKWWQRTWTGMLLDNLPAILTDPGEEVLTDVLNWVGYELYNLNQEKPLTFKQYSQAVGLTFQKFKKPSESALESAANALGPVGAPIQVAIQNTRSIEELTNEKLSPEQRRLAGLLSMMQFANSLGLWPSDITGATRREFFEQKKINKGGTSNTTPALRPRPLPKPRPAHNLH